MKTPLKNSIQSQILKHEQNVVTLAVNCFKPDWEQVL